MLKIISIVCLCLLIFVFCKSPTSPFPQPEGTGYFIYENVKYNLDNMHMTGYPQDIDPLRFDVYLMESPVQDVDSLMTHVANTVVFWFYSPISTNLDTGTYTLVDPVSRNANTISGAFCGIDYSYSWSLRKNDPHDFKSLTANVKRNKNTYTIDFNGILDNYKYVEGHYEGTFLSF